MIKKPSQYLSTILASAGSLLLPLAASAHTIGGTGLASGVAHPLLGLDHLLAMVAVGIISVQMGDTKAAIWKIPALFVSFMLVGGLLGMLEFPMPVVEQGIALSVLCFGIVITVSKKLPLSIAIAATIVFAIMHGHAHGAEMSAITQPALYALGFVISTAALHMSGVLVGHFASKQRVTLTALRFAGAAMSVVGLVFLINAA